MTDVHSTPLTILRSLTARFDRLSFPQTSLPSTRAARLAQLGAGWRVPSLRSALTRLPYLPRSLRRSTRAPTTGRRKAASLSWLYTPRGTWCPAKSSSCTTATTSDGTTRSATRRRTSSSMNFSKRSCHTIGCRPARTRCAMAIGPTEDKC
jgi:hypothetical protein